MRGVTHDYTPILKLREYNLRGCCGDLEKDIENSNGLLIPPIDEVFIEFIKWDNVCILYM